MKRWPLAKIRVAGLAVGMCAVLIPFRSHAQLSQDIRVKNFTFPVFYEKPAQADSWTNRLKNRLTGADGRYLSNNVIRITNVRVENYPPDGKGTNLVASSPDCVFDARTRLVTSTNRLDILGADGRLRVSGSGGFVFNMTNSTLTISNRVRAFISGSLLPSTKP